MRRRAIIVGARGQDGQLLNHYLINNDYDVYPIDRQNFDILNYSSVLKLIGEFKPDELYYLAAFNFSSEVSDHEPSDILTKSFNTSVIGLGYFLQAICEKKSKCAVFNASSSLVFKEKIASLLDECSPKNPLSFYSNSKVAGMNLCDQYVHEFGLDIFSGILFNHESRYRGDRFLSKKIVKGAVNIKRGKEDHLVLNSLSPRVDWSDAQDFVMGMHLLLNSKANSGHYIFASGVAHSVEDFANIAFSYLGLDYKEHVSINPSLQVRKAEERIGDSTKLRSVTGWKNSISFEEMIINMIEHELGNDQQ